MNNYFENAPGEGKPGKMRGFDPEFSDIVDYILRITYRIWEGKQVGLCYDYYSTDCPVYTLAGYTQGAEEVVQNTLKTLGSFPDRTLHADNIIWGGNEDDGFHTSHLITTRMTNLGPSEFGLATHCQAEIQVIAHCVVRENKIVEEWLVRDNYSLAKQLGIDPQQWAKTQAALPQDPDSTFYRWRESELARVGAQTRQRSAYPPDSIEQPEQFIASALQNIWNAKLVGDCNQLYAEGARLHASARETREGVTDICAFYQEILGSIPDARLSVDYLCSNAMRDDAQYVAARWTLAGTHTGGTLWGPATGAPILILAESQYRLEQGRVVEEWLVFDELAVLTQVFRARQ